MEHNHQHQHPTGASFDELKKLMDYLVHHNIEHTEELKELSEQLKNTDHQKTYDELLLAIEDYQKGNDKLLNALKNLEEN